MRRSECSVVIWGLQIGAVAAPGGTFRCASSLSTTLEQHQTQPKTHLPPNLSSGLDGALGFEGFERPF
jgi:hypothetical protein